jgi:hypothetical protein
MVAQAVVDRLLSDCKSGTCSADEMRQDLICLARNRLLADAMRRVTELGRVHQLFKEQFLRAWVWSKGADLRTSVGNDDLFFESLRRLLPPYLGPALILYRGRIKGENVGISWTDCRRFAKKFALFGTQAMGDVCQALAGGLPPRKDAVILKAHAHQEEILYRQSWNFEVEREYIVDPRHLNYITDWVAKDR